MSVKFIWIGNECVEIQCPYCKKNIVVPPDVVRIEPCACGAKFLLYQSKTVTEEP